MTITKNTDESGFTLIELIIVGAIISILAVVTIPNFLEWRNGMYMKSAARDLYSTMQEARLIAIKNNSPTAVVFDLANNRYYLCDNPGGDGNWNGTGDYTGTGDNSIVYRNNLSDYGNGLRFGPGNITGNNSMSSSTMPADGVSYTTPAQVMAANSRGTGNGGYAYIQNSDGSKIYGIGTQTNGNIRIGQWNGGGWQ